MTASGVSRRRFVATAAAGFASIAIVPRRASAAPQFSLKMGTDNAALNPTNVRANQIFAEILKDSGGKLEIRDFPNNQLGGASQMLAQIRSGALDFMMADGGVRGNVVPLAAIFGVGFAFKDSQDAFAAFDGELGAHARKRAHRKGLLCTTTCSSTGWARSRRVRSRSRRSPISTDSRSALRRRSCRPTCSSRSARRRRR